MFLNEFYLEITRFGDIAPEWLDRNYVNIYDRMDLCIFFYLEGVCLKSFCGKSQIAKLISPNKKHKKWINHIIKLKKYYF